MGRYMDVPLTRGASVLCYAAIETPRRAIPLSVATDSVGGVQPQFYLRQWSQS